MINAVISQRYEVRCSTGVHLNFADVSSWPNDLTMLQSHCGAVGLTFAGHVGLRIDLASADEPPSSCSCKSRVQREVIRNKHKF